MPDHEALFLACFEIVRNYLGETSRPTEVAIKLIDGREFRIPLPLFSPRACSPNEEENSHSPDFRVVTVKGKTYHFTPTQAKIIGLLWEFPEQSADYLLEESGSEAERLRDLFRDHPAWGKLIVPGSRRSLYRLEK